MAAKKADRAKSFTVDCGPIAQVESLFRNARVSDAYDAAIAALPAVEDKTTQIRLRVLAGASLFEAGDGFNAIDCLRVAVREAEGTSADVIFNATLALFSRESQFMSPEEAVPALSRLRECAALAGSASALGGLHLVVARVEAFRGHCVKARRHLELSRHLYSLTDQPCRATVILTPLRQ
jgi:hypothetical protein